MLKYICSDLISSIISWTPLKDLKILSKASPIFDQEIHRQGIRVIYCRDDTYIDISGPGVIAIKNAQGILQVIKKVDGEHHDYDCLDKSYKSLRNSSIKFRDEIPDNVYYYCISLDDFVVVCIDSIGISIVRVTLAYFDGNGSMNIIQKNGKVITIEQKYVLHYNIQVNWYDDYNMYIDFDSCMIACSRVGIFGYSRFELIFKDDQWRKLTLVD